jgi:hypothetical protein
MSALITGMVPDFKHPHQRGMRIESLTAQEGFDSEEGRGTQMSPLDNELGEPGLHLKQKIKGSQIERG